MFKLISVSTPPAPATMADLEAKIAALQVLVATQATELKGVRALLATVAENTVNTQEAVLAARVEAQAEALKSLDEMQQTLLKGQLELGKKLEVVSGNTITNRATLAALSADTGRLTDRVGGLSTRVDGLEETTAVHSRAIRDIQYFLPEIRFEYGTVPVRSIRHYPGEKFVIPVPEGFDRKDASFFWIKGVHPADEKGIVRRAVQLFGRTNEETARCSYELRSGYTDEISDKLAGGTCYDRVIILWFVTAVRYPFRARLDEDAREAAASSAAASATSGKG